MVDHLGQNFPIHRNELNSKPRRGLIPVDNNANPKIYNPRRGFIIRDII